MKKRNLLLMLLLAIGLPWAANAQTVTVCNGTDNSQYVPFEGYNADANQHNQMIFPATDLSAMNGKEITQMVFYIDQSASNGSNTAASRLGTWTVSLGETTATTLSGLDNTTTLTQVYQGYFDCSTGTLTLAFSSNYLYHGGNLLVDLNHAAASWNRWYFLGVNQTENTAITRGSLYKFLPKTTFSYQTPPTCPAPTLNAAEYVTENQASFSWTENGSATNWVLQYSTSEDFTNAISTNRQGIPALVIRDLQPLTTYYVRVKADCGEGDQSLWSNVISFSTTAVAEAVGDAWADDFEGTTCGWELINGTVTQANWFWGTAENSGSGSHSIYTTNDNGNTCSYNTSSAARVYAAKLLTFADGKYTFQFDWKCNGETTSFDYLSVGLLPATAVITADNTNSGTLPTGWISVHDATYLNGVTAWQTTPEKTVQLESGNYYLVLRWRQDGSGGTGTGAAVDNLSITKVACDQDVTDLAVSEITTTSATLSWNGGEATQWQVAYSTASNFEGATEEIVSNASYNMSGLQSSSTYYVKVRAYCGGEDFGTWSDVLSFNTDCDAITTFPWTETFESYSAGDFNAPCWVNEHISGSGTYIFKVYTSTTGTNSTHQLQLPDQSDGTLTKLRLPEMTLPGNDYQFTIDVYRSSNYSNKTGEGVRVYVSTDGEIEGATELAFIPRYYGVANSVIPAENTGDKWYTYSLPIGISGTCYIILRGENQYGTSTYMDNFFVEQIPSCPKPQNLAVTNNSVTAHGATVTWAETGEATTWVVEYATNADFTAASTETVNDEPTYTFEGLDPETTYYARVKAHCGAGNESQYSNVVNFTTGAACVTPTGLMVTNLTGTTATLSWTESGEATSWQICLNNDEENLINANTNPYTLEGLTAETVYTAKVRGICNGEPTGWSSSVSFEPTAKLVIGSGTSTTGYLPTNTNYDFSYTQQIYTVAELGEAGVIESIDFYMTSTSDYDRDLDIYMVSTDKSSFTGNTDWIAVTDADLVFSGNVNFIAQSWTTITLDEGFIYNGTQNVAIIVDDNTEEWSSRNFRSFTVESNQAHYCYQDDTNIDPSAPSANTNSVTTSKNQIRILKTELSNCMKPTQFAATEVGPDFAVLSWTENGASEAWVIDYNGTTVNVTENPYTLEGLANETTYTVKVRPACDENLWSSEISFTTLEGCPAPENVQVSNITHNAATVAWTGYSDSYNVKYRIAPTASSEVLLEEGFESEETFANWTAISNNEANTTNGRYGRLSSAANTGDYGFAFSSYTSASDYNQYLISPELDNPGKIEFYYRHYNNVEQFKVGYSTTTNDLSAFTWGDVVSSTINWQLFEQGLNANVKYIAINYCSNYQYELYVDDIVIYASLPGGEWQTVTSNTNSCALSNLNPGTTYVAQVQGVCGDETTDWSESYNFTTAWPTFTKTIAAVGEEGWANGKGGYYFIASPVAEPVTPAADNGFIVGDYDLYYFKQACDGEGNEWINFKDQALGGYTLTNGKGYLYASKEGTTLTFTGAPGTNGDVPLDNYDGNARFKGWNLIGNPFAQDAYITKDFYTLENGDTYTSNTAGTAIHAMQGVLITAEENETSVTFTTEAPATSNSKLNMNLRSNNKQLDNAILVFGGDQQLGKMTFRANSSKIFMPVEGKDYAITSVEGQVGEVPVSFKAENNGTYSLSFTSEEVSFSYLHLIDNMTGNDVNLLQTPSYTFDARTSDYESRFRLVFATGSSANDDTFGFVNASGNFCIFGIEGEATVQVIDVLGHVLSSEQFNGSYEKQLNVAPGVYMIRLIQGNDIRVQKMVVR